MSVVVRTTLLTMRLIHEHAAKIFLASLYRLPTISGTVTSTTSRTETAVPTNKTKAPSPLSVTKKKRKLIANLQMWKRKVIANLKMLNRQRTVKWTAEQQRLVKKTCLTYVCCC